MEFFKWLGIRVSENTEWCEHVTILGIIFDLRSGVIVINPSRWGDLQLEITWLHEDWFPPGAAAETRGELMFISSHYSGRYCRTYLEPIADHLGVDNRVLGCRLWVKRWYEVALWSDGREVC